MYQVFGPDMFSSIVEKETTIQVRTLEWGQLLKPFLEHKVQVHQTQEMCYYVHLAIHFSPLPLL
jgi:hypothetical protein